MTTYKVPKWLIDKLSVDNNLITIVQNSSYRYKNALLIVTGEANLIGRDYYRKLLKELKEIRED